MASESSPELTRSSNRRFLPFVNGLSTQNHLFHLSISQAAKAAQAKVRKAGKGERDVRKKATEDFDEFDMMTDDKNLNTSLRFECFDFIALNWSNFQQKVGKYRCLTIIRPI